MGGTWCLTLEVWLGIFRGTIMNIRKQPGHPRVDYQPCASWTRGFNAASWGFFNDFPGTGPITPPLPPESENATYTWIFGRNI